MRTVMKASVLVIALMALLACFAVAQEKPKVSATVMGQLPASQAAPAQPQVAPKPAPAAAPQAPPLGSFVLVPPQYFLDTYSTHTYRQIQEGWRDYVIREQSRAIVALQKRVEALEKAGQAYGGEPVEPVETSKPVEGGEVKP